MGDQLDEGDGFRKPEIGTALQTGDNLAWGGFVIEKDEIEGLAGVLHPLAEVRWVDSRELDIDHRDQRMIGLSKLGNDLEGFVGDNHLKARIHEGLEHSQSVHRIVVS
jgi:hypothetical protein